MKKILFLAFITCFVTEVLALSCMRPDPLPSLRLSMAQNRFEIVGIAEILAFETEDFIEDQKTGALGMNLTATGQNRKYTIHSARWKTVKHGNIDLEQNFSLRVNATSWMGNITKFEPGQIITITTDKVVTDGQLVLDQDFGCGRNEWNRYTVEEIESLSAHKKNTLNEIEKNQTNKIIPRDTNPMIHPEMLIDQLPWWQRFLMWLDQIF